MLRIGLVLLALLSFWGRANQEVDHQLGVHIPPVLRLEVRELGWRFDGLVGEAFLVLEAGNYTLRVVANTRWRLIVVGAGGEATVLEGKGRQELPLQVSEGRTVQVRLELRE